MTTSSPAYLADDGRPRLRKSVAGFIDMLGFSSMAIADQTQDEAQQSLEKIVAAVNDSRQFVREALQDDETSTRPWALKYFSDNLVVGFPFEDDEADALAAIVFVLRCAQRYQLRMALNGFFIRGAITSGLICLTDDVIFGPTLVESYLLESKTAIVPRILVTDPVQETLRKGAGSAPQALARSADDLICRDIDGWWFVNYLAAARTADGLNWEFIEQHKQSILTSLSGTKRHDILPKYGWACRYHNLFCHWHRDFPGFSEKHRIDRVDERSTIARMTDVKDG